MKNENVITFTVRLNQNKASHREAWEILRTAGQSHTETIVAALNSMKQNKGLQELEQLISNCVREAIVEVLPKLTVAASPVSNTPPPMSNVEISDDDFDIADDFMNGL